MNSPNGRYSVMLCLILVLRHRSFETMWTEWIKNRIEGMPNIFTKALYSSETENPRHGWPLMHPFDKFPQRVRLSWTGQLRTNDTFKFYSMAVRSRNLVRLAGRDKRPLLCRTRAESGAHAAFCQICTSESIAASHESNRSPLCSAEVKNALCYTAIPR